MSVFKKQGSACDLYTLGGLPINQREKVYDLKQEGGMHCAF